VQLRFIEAGHGYALGNWGKFAVGVHTMEEWREPSHAQLPAELRDASLLAGRGWRPGHVWVMDLQTGEAAMFRPGGLASADLRKHQIWVCPLFEPMLEWLYTHVRAHPGDWFETLPRWIELPGAEFSMYGYRRPGLGKAQQRRREWRTRVYRTRRAAIR
jgi:hypothetical protein